MKKSLLVLCLGATSLLMAQENARQNEIGLTTSNMDYFGLTYRTGQKEAMWRFNTLYTMGSKREEGNDSINYKSNSIALSFSAGREYRRPISEKLEFRYGADLSFGFQQSFTENSQGEMYYHLRKSVVFSPGINLVLGLNYIIGEHFIIGAELLPGGRYQFGTQTQKDYVDGEETTEDVTGFDIDLSNSAMLSFAYRF